MNVEQIAEILYRLQFEFHIEDMVSCLRKAIKYELWDDVRVMLENPQVQDRIRDKIYCLFGYEDDEVTPHRGRVLHLVLQRRAPVDIIRRLFEIDPGLISSESTPNVELPLHFAVKHGRAARTSERKRQG